MTDVLRIISIAAPILEILGIVSACHAVLHARTPQGAIAWAVSLISMPWFALPAYWVLGRSRFQGYLIARRDGTSQIQKRVVAGLKNFDQEFGAPLQGESKRFEVLESLAMLPFSRGNRIKVLVDGDETFEAIFRGIDAAQEYLLVQYFIVHDDEIGKQFQEKIIAKAKSGVKVLILYDEIGCHKLSNRYLQPLRDAGIQVSAFHSTKGRRNRFQLNFRNHRKIVIADGKLGYVGGLNVGDEYLGRSERFGHWRDTHLEVEGPVVTCLQLAFAEDWLWATDHLLTELNWHSQTSHGHNQQALVLPTGPADELESCGLFFSHLIHSARERIWIASPYFVPDNDVVAALQLAALRGVDVRVMLPAMPDHKLVYWSSFTYIEESAPFNVKFYRYQKGFLHQKTVLVDDDFAAVGTANLDNRSFRLNFEITVASPDEAFVSDVAEMLTRDFVECRQVTEKDHKDKGLLFRLRNKFARLSAPIQ